MKRRWIIRIAFMLPIAFCVFGWVWSGLGYSRLIYATGTHGCEISTNYGVVMLAVGRTSAPSGWHADRATHLPNFFFHGYSRALLGFWFRTVGGASELDVPYWFFIALFSGILFIAWRKTGVREVKAFPVEMEKRA